MAEDQDKSAAGGKLSDKQQARRDRQARALRENLRRRKARVRGNAADGDAGKPDDAGKD